jgi:hypothetical protein
MNVRVIWSLTGLRGVCGVIAHAQEAQNAPDQSELNCTLGPLQKTFGKTPWYVYGCDDGGSKETTDAAFEELKVLTESDGPRDVER